MFPNVWTIAKLSEQTLQTQIRLLCYTVCHSICITWIHFSMKIHMSQILGLQGGCLYRTTNDNCSANHFTGHQFDFPLICLRRLALPPANARVCLSNDSTETMIPFSVSSLLCPLAENFLHCRITWHLSAFQAWGWSQNKPETGQLTPKTIRLKTTRPTKNLALRQLTPDSEHNSPHFIIL